MLAKKCLINMIWSEESDTWYATSDDVPGLATGARTFDDLIKKLRIIVQELLEDNLSYKGSVEIHFATHRIEHITAVL